jgi:hypothetical protein
MLGMDVCGYSCFLPILVLQLYENCAVSWTPENQPASHVKLLQKLVGLFESSKIGPKKLKTPLFSNKRKALF